MCLGVGQPRRGLLGEVGEPLELACVVRVRGSRSLGTHRPRSSLDEARPSPEWKGVGRVDGDASARASTTGGSPKAGCGEVVLNIEDAGVGDGDAVPLVEAMDGDVTASTLIGNWRHCMASTSVSERCAGRR